MRTQVTQHVPSQSWSLLPESTVYAGADGWTSKSSAEAGRVNVGANVGDTFRLSTVVRTLTDPSTGRVIDRIEREVGSLRITSLANRYAVAELVGTLDIKRGDFVHL